MQPDWDSVKRTTLWNYEDLLNKLTVLSAYPVLWQAYNHDLPHAAVFARRLFGDNNIESGEYPARVLSTIECLKSTGISNWGNLLSNVPTRAKCAAFVCEHNRNFEEFIDVLNYLLRWGFPFQTASRELLEHKNQQEMEYYAALKEHKLMTSFDILERGCTVTGRNLLAELTGLPLEFITSLVHRADIARLPYVRRKTILPLFGAGYDTLAKIAAADLPQMESDMETYFRQKQGKSWENYKAVIVLKLLVTWARALPVIVDLLRDGNL
jgi:hypothetical protein